MSEHDDDGLDSSRVMPRMAPITRGGTGSGRGGFTTAELVRPEVDDGFGAVAVIAQRTRGGIVIPRERMLARATITGCRC